MQQGPLGASSTCIPGNTEGFQGFEHVAVAGKIKGLSHSKEDGHTGRL